MPIPSGPVMKACLSASRGVRPTHHLPGVVDAKSNTVSSTAQSTKVSHAHPIGAGDESMVSAASRVKNTHHLAVIVEARSKAVNTTQSAKVSHPIPSGPVMKAW